LDYFFVDVEASGPVPGFHDLLSIGATHVRRQDGAYQLFDDFYAEIKPVFGGQNEAAMRVHGLDMDRLASEGLEPRDGMARFAEWTRARLRNPREKPIFTAHNAPFDWMYCAYYFQLAGIPNPFGHSALDTKALAMGALKLPWVGTSQRSLASKLPSVPPRDPATIHHAGQDARYGALVFAALMNAMRAP
jgi:DNA polymerase III epsilon subunit-like protein